MKNTSPAIALAAGAGIMVAAPDTPQHVRHAGICIAGIAAILADLKSGKKLGYTDKLMQAVRTVPGLQGADEGTVLGLLTLGASTFLAAGEGLNMVANGFTGPGALKIAYNVANYPLSTVADFARSKAWLENQVGKEFTFSYKDTAGGKHSTKPISTAALLQQLALISGAVGITTYGTLIEVPAVQFTGLMFMLSNGLSIGQLAGGQISEVLGAKMEQLSSHIRQPAAGESTPETLQREWVETREAFSAETRGQTQPPVDPEALMRLVEKVSEIVPQQRDARGPQL